MRVPAMADRVMALRPRGRALVAALLGAVAATGQAPLDAWPLTLVALAALFGLMRRATGARQAAWTGLAAGTGYFALALSWLVEPFLVDVARHGWMAPFALLGMSIGLALFWALTFALARAAGRSPGAWAAAFVLAEALRTYVLTGFPWAQIGHVWIDTAMLHWAAWAGSLGLTALAAVAAAALWQLVNGQLGKGLPVLFVLTLLHAGGAALAPENAPGPEAPVIRLVQPNAVQHEKWDHDKMQVFYDRQVAFTAAPANGARPGLVVWPETAVPVPLDDAGPHLREIAAAAGGGAVVAGFQRLDGLRFYNTLAVIGPDGTVAATYDKHHLVPFGEYVPFGDVLGRYGIGGLASRQGYGYSSGPGAQVIEIGGLGRALPLICYESVFPQDVSAAPERPDFMLLITNDAWFGQVSGPYQHLAQARLRSAEQGLPMIRVANTGVSAMIDAAGRVSARIPLGQAGWLDTALPPPLPPTVYARAGDAPIAGLALILLGLSLLHHRRKTRPV